MSYGLGVAVALAQFFLVRWLESRWPNVCGWLGYGFAAILAGWGVSLLRNPYVGELHGGLIVAFLLTAFYVGTVTLLRGAPSWISLGIGFFDLALLVPVLTVSANLRNHIGLDLYATNVPRAEAWMDRCDEFSNAFAVSWLIVVLAGAAATRWNSRRRTASESS